MAKLPCLPWIQTAEFCSIKGLLDILWWNVLYHSLPTKTLSSKTWEDPGKIRRLTLTLSLDFQFWCSQRSHVGLLIFLLALQLPGSWKTWPEGEGFIIQHNTFCSYSGLSSSRSSLKPMPSFFSIILWIFFFTPMTSMIHICFRKHRKPWGRNVKLTLVPHQKEPLLTLCICFQSFSCEPFLIAAWPWVSYLSSLHTASFSAK